MRLALGFVDLLILFLVVAVVWTVTAPNRREGD